MGCSLVAVHGLLIAVASPVADELKGTQTSVLVAHGLSSVMANVQIPEREERRLQRQ